MPNYVHFFHIPRIVLIKVGLLFSPRPRSSSTSAFLSHLLFYNFVSHSRSSSFSIFLSAFSLIMLSSMAFFKSVLGNHFGKPAKCRGLKIDTVVVLYGKQYGSSKVMRSERISDAGVASPDEFQRLVHGIGLNRGSCSDLNFENAVVIQKNIILVWYRYQFCCTLKNGVPETLRDVYIYAFNVCNLQAMKRFPTKAASLHQRRSPSKTKTKKETKVAMAWKS